MALDSLIASAEASIIGSVLIEPAIVGELMQTVHPEDFSNAELRRVYEAVRAVWLESGNIDAVTVCAAAGSDTQPVIARCMIETPSAASWTEYAKIVKDAARLRRMQTSAMRIVSASTLRDAELAAEDLNRSAIARSGVQITSMTDGIERLYKELCAGNKPQYLKWGMPQLDYQLFTELGDFIILAGYGTLINSVNGNKPVLINAKAEKLMGCVVNRLIEVNSTDPETIKNAGQKILNECSELQPQLQVSAIDRSGIDPTLPPFLTGQWAIVEVPHSDLETAVQIVEVKTDLLKPNNPQITLGSTPRKITTMLGGRK